MTFLDEYFRKARAKEEEPPPVEKVTEPGNFPKWMLDQDTTWVDPQGYAHKIADMVEAEVLFSLDYLLANAAKLRTAWAHNWKKEYNEKERPRQWMLKREVVRALIVRLIELEKKGRNPWE